jgi:HSP20 family protein
MNSVHCRVGSLGKCTRCTHPDCVVPEPAAAERPKHEGDQMLRTQWYPFQDLRSAQEERAQTQFDRLFAHALGLHGQWQSATGTSTPAWAPALNISERKDAHLVTVELPGVKLDDLEITLEDGLLTIQGERQFTSESSEEQFHRVERSSGAFRRAITLPAHVEADTVEASMEDGVLQILVPKAEEAQPKRIQINPGGQMEAIAASSATS